MPSASRRSSHGRGRPTTSRRPVRGVAPPRRAVERPAGTFVAEAVEGLEPFVAAEVAGLTAEGITGPGAVRFEYAGPWRDLLTLRTAVAVHAVVTHGLPRPAALLDDGAFRAIAATVGHVRSLQPAGSYTTLRLSAAGLDSAAFHRFRERLAAETGLRDVSTEGGGGDLLLRFRRGPDGAFELLVRLSPRPLTARPWRRCNLPGALNAAIASAMAALTAPAADDVFLNLGCGSGTLLVERAALGPAGRLIGCDLDPRALACADENAQAAGLTAVELHDWDARALPLADSSVSALAVDLPFGQLLGSHTENEALYPALLAEAARVARPGARLAAITQQTRLFERSVAAPWIVERAIHLRLPTNAAPIALGLYVLVRA
ncbi:MAG: RNA methyltransferase [Chloroflexi bacterium]|nr:RNA methyltransferase [Chloroflexota bacterium]